MSPVSVAPPLAGIEEELATDLAEVDRILASQVDSRLKLVELASRYLYQSGGKRIRPMIVLLAARATGEGAARAARFGAIVEIIHTATLVHDDIVDQADTRRGRESLNHMLGNDVTVLIGDYLYIRSMSLAAAAGDLRIVEMICDLTERMIEGMLLETMRGGTIGLTRAEHLNILRLKTACLFDGCGRIGARLSGAEPDIEEALGTYGMNLGMAFQVADDLFDFTASAEKVGKPVLSDLKEGHLTLPVLHALEQEPEAVELVEEVLASGVLTEATREQILELVERCGGLLEARQVAEGYARAAREALTLLAPSRFRDALVALTDFVISRDR